MAIATRVAGAVLIVVGVGLAARSAALLAGRGRPQRGPRPAFVIAGPYRRVRNPLYAGLLLSVLGVATALRSETAAVAAVVAACAAHAWVVAVEEPSLAVRFGDAYAAYLARVPRWLPRPSSDDERAG